MSPHFIVLRLAQGQDIHIVYHLVITEHWRYLDILISKYIFIILNSNKQKVSWSALVNSIDTTNLKRKIRNSNRYLQKKTVMGDPEFVVECELCGEESYNPINPCIVSSLDITEPTLNGLYSGPFFTLDPCYATLLMRLGNNFQHPMSRDTRGWVVFSAPELRSVTPGCWSWVRPISPSICCSVVHKR